MSTRALLLAFPLLLAASLTAAAQGVGVTLNLQNQTQFNAIVAWTNKSTGASAGNIGIPVSGSETLHDAWQADANPFQDFSTTITVPGRACRVEFRVRMSLAQPGSGSANSLTVENIAETETRLSCRPDFQCTSVGSDAANASCTVTIAFRPA